MALAVGGLTRPLSADVLLGTEGNFSFLLGEDSGYMLGWGGSFEFGFVPGKGGIKLAAGVEKGRLNSFSESEGRQVETEYSAFLISAMLKYNTPTRLPFTGMWAKKASYYIYSLNPWIGLGPALQVNQAITSEVSQNFDPSSDYLIEMGLGFNISLGIFGIRDKEVRNLFVVTDFRYTYNLSSIERYNNQGRPLDSSEPLFPTFENFFTLRLGVAYKF